MEDMDILSQLIMPDAQIQLEDEYGKKIVKLIEPDAPTSEVIIRNLPRDSVVIKADKFPALRQFFIGDKGERKRADYIIISAEKKVIIFIEIKLGSKNWGHVLNQLKGAACLLKYCQEIGKRFWNEEMFLEGYSYRFVSIRKTSINKGRSHKYNRAEVHDTPEKAMQLTSPHHLQFNKLAKG